MQLLVSVRDAREVPAALTGGAQIVDAKEPSAGALGAVSATALAAIAAALPEQTPLSVALGDTLDVPEAYRAARQAADVGARFVKLGFLGLRGAGDIEARLRAAAKGAGGGVRVIAVAYADAEQVGAPPADAVLAAAATCGADGVLLDTAGKRGGLFDLLTDDDVRAWVDGAHASGLMVALAGSLGAAGIERAGELGADVVGVRGAACDGGREGRLSERRVRELARVALGSQMGGLRA